MNSFYTNSFNHLIIYTVALMGFLGVVIPILVQIYQNRRLRIEREGIEKSITEKMNATVAEVDQQIKSAIDKEMKIFEDLMSDVKKDLDKKLKNANGISFHISGNMKVSEKQYSVAIGQYIGATNLYINGDDEGNLRAVIHCIYGICLPEISKQDFKYHTDLEKDIESLIEKLQSFDQKRRFPVEIEEIKRAFQFAKERQEKALPTE